MAVEPRELKFIATAEKGEVSALYARPRGARALLVLGHGSGTNMRHLFHAGTERCVERCGDCDFAL